MAEKIILSLIDFEEKDLASVRLMAGERKVVTLKDLGCKNADEVPFEI